MPVSVSAPRGLARLAPALRALVLKVFEGEARRLGEVSIVLSDDELLRQINRDWRSIDRATDVISFAYDERTQDADRPVSRARRNGHPRVNGDLFISMDRVNEQAKRYRVTRGAELARLVVHGALHLCGHDHVRAAERKLMRAREESAFRRARAGARVLDRLLDSARVGRAPR